MMPWWWVSLVYCLVGSECFFHFCMPALFFLFAASEKIADHGLYFFLGIGVYACATGGIWVRSVHIFFHSFPKASALPSLPWLQAAQGAWKGLGEKQKLKRALSSWWCPQVLGSSAGRRAAVALVPLGLRCGRGLGAAVLSTVSLTCMVCLLGEGIAFWSTVGVKGWGLI